MAAFRSLVRDHRHRRRLSHGEPAALSRADRLDRQPRRRPRDVCRSHLRSDFLDAAHAPGDAAGVGEALSRARWFHRRAGGKGQRVPPHPEVRPHTHAGCGSHAAGPGIHRLCRSDQARARNRSAQQSELLREVGLGGSAVGTGINTHPDYRAESRCRTLAHLRTEAARGRRHALCDAVEPRNVERQFGAAQSGAGDDSHLERPAPAVVRAEHRVWARSTCPHCSRVRRSCRARSIL